MAAVMLPLPLSLAPRKFLALVRARRMHSSSLPQHSTTESCSGCATHPGAVSPPAFVTASGPPQALERVWRSRAWCDGEVPRQRFEAPHGSGGAVVLCSPPGPAAGVSPGPSASSTTQMTCVPCDAAASGNLQGMPRLPHGVPLGWQGGHWLRQLPASRKGAEGEGGVRAWQGSGGRWLRCLSSWWCWRWRWGTCAPCWPASPASWIPPRGPPWRPSLAMCPAPPSLHPPQPSPATPARDRCGGEPHDWDDAMLRRVPAGRSP